MSPPIWLIDSGVGTSDTDPRQLTSAGIELCKSLQHRVAADTQATKIIEQREAEAAPAEGNVSGADGASLNGADDHASSGSPGTFVRTRRRPVHPARVSARSARPQPATPFKLVSPYVGQ